jgi:tetraacyldisaccharide 4'-kinase
LRETISSGVRKSDIVLIIGAKNEELETRIKCEKQIPIFYAKMDPINFHEIENKKVIGFCGLGYPKKFKQTLQDCGFELVDFIEFADHHPYTITEVQKLIRSARSTGAKLVTTMKDYVKIPEIFKSEIFVIKITLRLENDEFKEFLLNAVSNR